LLYDRIKTLSSVFTKYQELTRMKDTEYIDAFKEKIKSTDVYYQKLKNAKFENDGHPFNFDKNEAFNKLDRAKKMLREAYNSFLDGEIPAKKIENANYILEYLLLSWEKAGHYSQKMAEFVFQNEKKYKDLCAECDSLSKTAREIKHREGLSEVKEILESAKNESMYPSLYASKLNTISEQLGKLRLDIRKSHSQETTNPRSSWGYGGGSSYGGRVTSTGSGYGGSSSSSNIGFGGGRFGGGGSHGSW
jgi:hypothetical protein